MNLVEYYSSDDNTPVELHKTAEADRQLQKRIKINPCPDVHIENSVNLDFLPVQGPANPFVVERNVTRNIMSGHVQEHVINPAVFNALQRSFENHGYTLPPDAPTDNLPTAPQNPKRIRKDKGSVDSPSFMGPWAGFHGQDTALPEDTSEFVPAAPFDKSKINSLNVQESSIFHGKEQFDYLGRSYMHPPSDLDINLLGDGGTQNCFIPKRLAHTWTGHTKGVNCIRWFPKSAHLILSASMDQKIKLWDVYHKRECLRTYIGHSKAIRDVCFGLQGLTFLSASYDRNIKEWDTETGQVKGRFETSKFPFCVTYHPTNPHIFLTGCQDHKIYQFDTRSGKIVNEYVSHHGAVNTITFLDDDRRFASTSDDKSIKCWEFDLPVVVKYVAESDLNSMPAVSRSHDRKWLIAQSLDNCINVFAAQDKFRMNRKKKFQGHLVAGYACQPGLSPDGRFVFSGDSQGLMWFWDWKTCNLRKKYKAHDGVIMSTLWHPHETSKIATCSWDGNIKLWD